MQERTLTVDVPLDLRSTLAPIGFPWARSSPDGWWRPLRAPAGPATLHLHRRGGEVVARGWGPGSEWVLDHLAEWIGLSDDPASFAPIHPVLRRLHRQAAGSRFGRTGLVPEALLTAVTAQKVTGREAARGLRGMVACFSEAAPGPAPGLRLPPDPERLAAAPYHHFHRLGIERRRADVIRRVASEWWRLARLAEQPPGEARQVLERIPGVGRWTSAETVAVSHGDPDAVSVGDFHHKHLVAWHLAGEERGTDERMLELLEPHRPHRGRVVRLLERAGTYPRRGPRLAPRSFADR